MFLVETYGEWLTKVIGLEQRWAAERVCASQTPGQWAHSRTSNSSYMQYYTMLQRRAVMPEADTSSAIKWVL